MLKNHAAMLLFLVLVAVVLSLLLSTKPKPQEEAFQASTEVPLSGIARCHYGSYTPLLTCGYKAFKT